MAKRETMRPEQLADRWSISIRTLERWRADRIGPSYTKLGHSVVYLLRDIEKYEQSNRVNIKAKS